MLEKLVNPRVSPYLKFIRIARREDIGFLVVAYFILALQLIFSLVFNTLVTGHILNDNDAGIDYLGHSVYAKALAETIVNVSTPVTIGVFARWGSGKSFLVKHVCSYLQKHQRQAKASPTKFLKPQSTPRCCCTAFLLVILVLLFIALGVGATSPDAVYSSFAKIKSLVDEDPQNLKQSPTIKRFNATENSNSINGPVASGDIAADRASNSSLPIKSTKKEETQKAAIQISGNVKQMVKFIRLGSLFGLIIVVVVVCVVMCCSHNLNMSTDFLTNCKLIAYAAFTKLPIAYAENTFIQVNDSDVHILLDDKESSDLKEIGTPQKRYIFVNFSAWEYAGSDNLWAGIATNLSDAIESEFGSVVPRLFRIFELQEMPKVEKNPVNKNRSLLVELKDCELSKSDLRHLLEDYGVVLLLEQRTNSNQTTSSRDNCWVVEYSDFQEAKTAKTALEKYGLCVHFFDGLIQQETNLRSSNTKRSGIELQTIPSTENERKTLVSRTTTSEKNCRQNENQSKKISFWRHFRKYPKKTCHWPVFYWSILLMISAIMLPIMTYLVAQQLSLSVIKSARTVPVAVQVFAWMPGITGSVYVILRFIWAMFHSQRSRIKSALEGTNENMASALGMMDKIKHEVHMITKLIHCAEFSHHKKYTVVITIDDLDRVPHDKVKSVLEAVSILLSDRSSPFVCLIALDSRVAVKCIEEGMGLALLKANVNGHEYLKKIINLPFCLPEIHHDNKSQYIQGLIDQADVTNTRLVQGTTDPRNNNVHGSVIQSYKVDYLEEIRETDLSGPQNSPDTVDGVRSYRSAVHIDGASSPHTNLDGGIHNECSGLNWEYPPIPTNKTLSNKEFLFECRRFLQTDKVIRHHLHGNPRNIKRIFNVLSLTAVIINCTENEKKKKQMLEEMVSRRTSLYSLPFSSKHVSLRTSALARDIVRWVILTDQWPFRMSYLLQVIEDADQRSSAGKEDESIKDTTTIFDIYKTNVRKEISSLSEDNKQLLSLDADPDTYYSFIKQLGNPEDSPMNKGKAKLLKLYTVNLDHSLRQSIANQRELVDCKEGQSVGSENSDPVQLPLATIENQTLPSQTNITPEIICQ